MAILSDLSKDARFYLNLRFPKASPSFLHSAKVWCISRGLWVLAAHRMAHHYAGMHPVGWFMWAYKIWLRIMVKVALYLSKVLAKCDIRPSTDMVPGVFLSNDGHIVLGARSIGSGTIIHDRVTIGMSRGGGQVPIIGRNVWIGSNCVIYGDLTIGDGSTILPDTVLTKSIPPGTVVQGNPARIVRREFENSKLRSSLSTDYALVLGASHAD